MTAPSQVARGAPGKLSEGRAPVRERLMAMLFLMAMLHAVIILGVGFSGGLHGGADEAPQVDVLLVTRDVPEARANPRAAYLAQRRPVRRR